MIVVTAAFEEHALHQVKRERKGYNHAADLQDKADRPGGDTGEPGDQIRYRRSEKERDGHTCEKG